MELKLNAETVLKAKDALVLVADKSTEVANLQRLHGQKMSEDVFVAAGVQPLDDLLESKQSLLVAVELGKADQTDIDTVESKIEAARKASDDHAELVDGLSKNLTVAQGELKNLGAENKEIVAEALLQEAERIGGEYLSAAQTCVDVFRKLIAISNYLDANGNRPANMAPICSGGMHQRLDIPLFRLACHSGAGVPNDSSVLASAHAVKNNLHVNGRHILGGDLYELKKELVDLGVLSG